MCTPEIFSIVGILIMFALPLAFIYAVLLLIRKVFGVGNKK